MLPFEKIFRAFSKQEIDIMQFRKDINGLRAIAVLPVIFFHSGVTFFQGGFLGVDVFFAISGFLITSNIINTLNTGDFTLIEFYDRRARRILPALVFTLLVTLIFSFIFMLPYDLKNFGQSLVATSIGANNILLYFTSGYWSLAAEYKPLYHTWSLGVEEQYYLITPLIFLALFKNKKVIISTLVLLLCISYISNYFIQNREFNFLIILTRFWELGAGSLLAVYMVYKPPVMILPSPLSYFKRRRSHELNGDDKIMTGAVYSTATPSAYSPYLVSPLETALCSIPVEQESELTRDRKATNLTLQNDMRGDSTGSVQKLQGTAVYITEEKNNKLSVVGFCLIVLSYLNPNLIPINIVNIFPVIGALMVIAFTTENGIIYKLLSSKFLIIIGLTSYSIYFLHQPLLSFLRLGTEGEPSVYNKLIVSLMSLPLGYLVWRFIENPFRNKNIISNKLFYLLTTCFIVLFISVGFFLHKTYGMQQYRIFDKYSYGENPQAYNDRPYTLSKDEFTSESKKMLIIGNSFARDFYNALNENKATKGYEVIYLYNYYTDVKLSRKLMSSADISIWVSSAGMANQKPDTTSLEAGSLIIKNELQKYSNGNYFYIGTKNFGRNNNFVKQIYWKSSLDYLVQLNESNIIANKIEGSVFGDRYIDLLSLFRVGDKVRIFTENHKFISFDTDHITKDGAIYLGKKVLKSVTSRAKFFTLSRYN